MMSALECFQKADQREAMARGCCDPINARVLRVTAEHWRGLGDAANAAENLAAPVPWTGKPDPRQQA